VRKTHISPKIQEIAGTQKNTGICRKYRNGESTATGILTSLKQLLKWKTYSLKDI